MKSKNPSGEITPLYPPDTVLSSTAVKKQIFSSSVSRLNHVRKQICAQVSQERSGKSLLTLVMMCLFFMVTSIGARAADVNVLIVGPSGSSVTPFQLGGVKDRLKNIVDGAAGIGDVNIEYLNTGSNGLLAWHFNTSDTYPELARWANLRGESGTDWDYVILLGETFAMERVPAAYFEGVAHVAAEVEKGGAEVVLLMPWPQLESFQSLKSTVVHYKEIVYRAGRSGGYKVVPAGLAWEAAGSPSSASSHPTADGAFITAASIYSRIWGESASSSDYVYNDTMANTVHTSVQANIGVEQFTGPFITSVNLRPYDRKDRRTTVGVTLNSSTENQLRSAIDYIVKANKGTTDGGGQFAEGRGAHQTIYNGMPRWYWSPPWGSTEYWINKIPTHIKEIDKWAGYPEFRDNVFPILLAQLRKRVPFIPVTSGGAP